MKGWTWSAGRLQKTPEPLMQSRMDPCFCGVHANFWPSEPSECHCRNWNSSQCFGEAVRKVDSISCFRVFRDALLHSLALSSGYLSHCCLLPILLWPLTPTRQQCFVFLGPFPVNPRNGCGYKSQVISTFWDTQSSSGIHNQPILNVTLISFLLQFGLDHVCKDWIAAMWLADQLLTCN